jgi:hypothetical protein
MTLSLPASLALTVSALISIMILGYAGTITAKRDKRNRGN